jgi:hypothetical protein
MQERRRAERVRTSLYAIWEMTQQSVFSGNVANFSVTGCFVQSKSGLPAKPVVDIRFRLPTERWMTLQGSVVYVGEQHGFGVSFAELSKEDRSMLELLMEYYREEA